MRGRAGLIQTLMKTFAAAESGGGPVNYSKKITGALGNLLQGLGILRAGGVVCNSCGGDPSTSKDKSFYDQMEDGLEWTVPFGQKIKIPIGDLDFGFGPLPIKLKIDGAAFDREWALDLTFGFQRTRGFYLKKTDTGSSADLASKDHDLRISAEFDAHAFTATGSLFFLQLAVSDYRPRLAACLCEGACGADDAAPDKMTDAKLGECFAKPHREYLRGSTSTKKFLQGGMIGIELKAYLLPEAEDAYVTLKSLKSRKGSVLGVHATAYLRTLLQITASATANLPEFTTVLHADMSYAKSSIGGAKGGVFTRHLNFLYPHMDVGKFLQASVKPILDQIGGKLRPIVKPLKELVKEHAMLSKIMGRPAGILDFTAEMAGLMGHPKASKKVATVKRLVKVVVEIDNMINLIAGLTGGGSCFQMGDVLSLAAAAKRSKTPSSAAASGAQKSGSPAVARAQKKPASSGFAAHNVGELGGFFNESIKGLLENVVYSLHERCGMVTRIRPGRRRARRRNPKKEKDSGAVKDKLKGMFRLPMLENPSSAMGLFTGKTVGIVEFTSPPVEFGVDFAVEIQIYTPPTIALEIGGGVSIAASIIMGYDSSGIQQAIAQKNPLLALDGFYILTERKNEDGTYEKLYQVTVTAYIDLGFSLSVPFVKIKVGGRITVIIDIGLVDPLGIGNPDRGKLRLSTILLAFAAKGAGAFFELFRFRIRIILKLYAQLIIGLGFLSTTIELFDVSITLFDKTFEPEPFLQLADVVNGAMYIRTDRAANFVGGGSQVDVSVVHVSGEGGAETISVGVKSTYAFLPASSCQQVFIGISKVFQIASHTVPGSKQVQ